MKSKRKMRGTLFTYSFLIYLPLINEHDNNKMMIQVLICQFKGSSTHERETKNTKQSPIYRNIKRTTR